MSDESVLNVISDLEAKGRVEAALIVDLDEQRALAQGRHEAILQAVESLRAVVDDSAARELKVKATTAQGRPGPVSAASSSADGKKGLPRRAKADGSTITRVPSVQRLGDIVNRADRAFSRDDLFAAYMFKFGTGTWKQPRNVLSTALARAIERGLVRDLGDEHYGPVPERTRRR